MPLYEEKLINPLAIRFSQDRIWPDFQDGTKIEDSLTQIGTVTLKNSSYDVVLRPPFPPMEIIRIRQELREADGERILTDEGRRIYGEDSWFTFDNRRLYCLQRAALQLWPMVVAVVVKVLFDMPAVRCARHKFRTTSDGCSVKISLPDGQPGQLWNWQEAARSAVTTREGAASVMEAVRRDTTKTNKDMLSDVPASVLLAPGDRESTVAERFNLGAVQGPGGAEGKAAGQQLLSILHGKPLPQASARPTAPGRLAGAGLAGAGGAGGGGLAALFNKLPQQQVKESWENSWENGWNDSWDNGWHDGWHDGWQAEQRNDHGSNLNGSGWGTGKGNTSFSWTDHDTGAGKGKANGKVNGKAAGKSYGGKGGKGSNNSNGWHNGGGGGYASEGAQKLDSAKGDAVKGKGRKPKGAGKGRGY